MGHDFIPVNTPLLDGNERKYLNECIDTGWISSEGPFVNRFEERFARKVGRKFGVSVTNGTAALELLLSSLDLRPGDEVILPTFTIISCITQVIRLGCVPILVDADPITWNACPREVIDKISSRTKLILVVHIYGLPVDLERIEHECKKRNILLIEDAAEMHGQTYRDKPCGSFGDASTFSFYPNKHITTGEGGMIVTDNPVLYDKLRRGKNLYFGRENRYEHDGLGWNMRMTNLQAAVGLAQLERLDEFVQKKRSIGHFYNQALKDSKLFALPPKNTEYATSIYWVYGLTLKEKTGFKSKDIMIKLHSLGIGSRQFFCPLHKQPILKELGYFKSVNLPNSEFLYEHGFYIPCGLGLSEQSMQIVVDKILQIETELT